VVFTTVVLTSSLPIAEGAETTGIRLGEIVDTSLEMSELEAAEGNPAGG